MSFIIRPLLGIIATALVTSSAFANNSNNKSKNASSTTVTTQAPKKETKVFSGLFNISRSTNLYDFQDGSRKDGMDYMFRLGMVLTEDYSASAQGAYSQDLKDSTYNDVSDISLNVSRKATKLGNYFLLGYRVGAIIPTSKDSHKRQNLITALSTGLNMGVNPERLIQGLSISGSISLGRNIHQYETAIDGRVNSQYTSGQSLSIGYEFNSGVSLSASFVHKNSLSYQNVLRDAFEISQELGYQINPTFAVAIGHSNGGSSLKANGLDSNVELINENSSVVYASGTVLF